MKKFRVTTENSGVYSSFIVVATDEEVVKKMGNILCYKECPEEDYFEAREKGMPVIVKIFEAIDKPIYFDIKVGDNNTLMVKVCYRKGEGYYLTGQLCRLEKGFVSVTYEYGKKNSCDVLLVPVKRASERNKEKALELASDMILNFIENFRKAGE